MSEGPTEFEYNTDIDAYLAEEAAAEEAGDEEVPAVEEPAEEETDETDEGEDGEESGEEEAEASPDAAEGAGDTEGDNAAGDANPAVAKLKEELAPKPLKPVVAKAGDKDIEVPVDAKFDVKVDGEVKSVTTRELIDNYSSKQANYNFYQKVQQEKQQLERSAQQYDSVIDGFGKMVEEGRGLEAMAHLIEATGRDSLPIIRKLRETMATDAQTYINLSPEQKKLLAAEEELGLIKKREALKEQQTAAQKQGEALRAEVGRVVQTYGLSGEPEFIDWYRRAETYVTTRKTRGEIPQDFNITPEWVGQYADAAKKTQMMYEVLDEVAPDVRQDAEQVEKIAKLVASVKPTKEELKMALQEIYGSQTRVDQAVKDVNEKLREEKRASKPSVKPSRKTVVVEDDDDPGLDIDRTPNVKDWRKFVKS